MHCQLRSADRILFDGEASRITARSTRGEFAVLDGHAPLLAALAPGAVRILGRNGERIFACRRGSLRVRGDRAVLLVQSAVPLEEINEELVRARLAELREGGAARDAEEVEALLVLQAVRERHG